MSFIKNLFRKNKHTMNEEDNRNCWIDATGSKEFISEHGSEFYDKLDKINHKCERLVDLDMSRIVQRGNSDFQLRVRRILIAYLNYVHCEDYRSPLLAILQVVLQKIEDEFMTFVVFFQIMERYHWRYMLMDEENIKALIKDIDFQIAQKVPKVYKYLEDNGIEILTFVYTRIVTIFTLYTNFPTSIKIFEGFFIYKHEFLIKICLSVIEKHKKTIPKLTYDEAVFFLYSNMWDVIDEAFIMNLM